MFLSIQLAIYSMPGRGTCFENKMLPFTADSGQDAALCIAARTIVGTAVLLQVDAALKMEAQLGHGPIVPY